LNFSQSGDLKILKFVRVKIVRLFTILKYQILIIFVTSILLSSSSTRKKDS